LLETDYTVWGEAFQPRSGVPVEGGGEVGAPKLFVELQRFHVPFVGVDMAVRACGTAVRF